ncbi:kinase-like domain-containing protein [Favolaschia claudopus]|uniref:Kinase-like domain-containing protein n=1 Tax=Favolaschia claudopus TaxID=2862362 RepID=A0AAW0DDE2_9AGAR
MSTENTSHCNDCDMSFPQREGDGPCSKCVKLAAHPRDSADYADIATWDQCVMCGITRRNNMHPTVQGDSRIITCGSTLCKAAIPGIPQAQESRPATHNVPRTVTDLSALTRQRFKRFNHGATSTLQTQTLLQHERGGGEPGEVIVMVAWQVRIKKALASEFGQGAKGWAASVLLQDVKAQLTEQVSIVWQQRRGAPLLSEHVSIRWAGNKMPVPNSLSLTVGEFYAVHSSTDNSAIYVENVPSAWKSLAAVHKRKGGFMALELYIDSESWAESVDGDIAASLLGSKKRSIAEPAALSAAKRPRALHSMLNQSNMRLRSEFRPSGLSGPAPVVSRTRTTLKRMDCIVDPRTGDMQFESSFAGDFETTPSFLSDNGQSYVVKRFYRLTEDSENTAPNTLPFTVDEHLVQIQAEAMRIGLGQWFMNAFFQHARNRNVTAIDFNIAFTDAFLAEEIESPSPASGIPQITAESPGITWLVEPKRSTSVEHFSYTLVHKSRKRDLRSSTIYAFAHFVWGHSNQTMIFADLQGTPALVGRKDGLVLFDPMTHTVGGNSGIGDFGLEGINSFIRDHSCGDVCNRLALDEVAPLIFDTSSNEEQEEEQDNSPSPGDTDSANGEGEDSVD